MNVKSMLTKLENMMPNVKVEIGCKSYCGPCTRYVFIYINGRYVTGATEDQALEKAKRYIK